MAITRNQTDLGKNFPFLDHGDPVYDRLVNSVKSDDLHPNTIQMAEVAVTAAEMLSLATTAKELVAAPGSGYVLEFISAVFIFDYAAVFVVAGGDDIVVRFTNGSGTIVSLTLETTGLLDTAADAILTVKNLATDVALTQNAALVLDNIGSNWSGTGSPCRVKVAYRVHATGL